MSELTLGLDLGSNSIGWALIDQPNSRIVAAGVRVFPEGVDRDTSGAEVPKMQQRRLARAQRRQVGRRARRKRKLRKALVSAGLLPDIALLERDDPRRGAWEREQFDSADPYTLRDRALRERLDPHEIGRVLLHLSQRRGFLSNRKTDRAKKKENSEILSEISELASEMADRTLGQYLCDARGSDPTQFHLCSLRRRHTRRDMYVREFDAIWGAQRAYHPELLSDTWRDELRDIIFYQRLMRPPSPGLVGRCELEPRLPRCPRADRRAQRFRVFLEVNNLRVLDTSSSQERRLSDEERGGVIRLLFSKKERTFGELRKVFALRENVRFNLEAGERTKLKGMPTDAALANKSLFGKDWHGLPDDQKDRIVAAIIDDEPQRLRHLLSEAGLDPGKADQVLDCVDLEDGYASYSLCAIKRLLPHVARGLPLTSRDLSSACALREAGYTPSWERSPDRRPFLPPPPMVTNPLVRQALHEVQKVVNAILRDYVYKDEHTLAHVHIELAREVKGTAQQRQKATLDMRARERTRDEAAEKLREAGIRPTRDAIDRYILWEEQGNVCIYSGRTISFSQLIGGEVDIDHVLPYSRSLDNSQMNKVVCFRSENSQGVNAYAKGDRTPYEWLGESDPAKYEQVLQRAKRLKYPKLKRFYQRSLDIDDFFARQLVDTTYISTQVFDYVRCLGAEVLCPKGAHTNELRYHWGLNTVLRHDDVDFKNREDHRHHALDAIVIGLTDRSRLQQLAGIRRSGGTARTGEVLAEPWLNFRADVERVVNGILVSHRVRRRVAGALHDETIYGRTQSPNEYVYRKPLSSLTPAMVLKIRDDAIRDLVTARLRAHGIEPRRGAGKIPAEVWKEPLLMPSGIPVRKVRITVPSESIRAVRGGRAFVQPGNTHHVSLFEVPTADGSVSKAAVFTSMLEAIDRVKRKQPVIQRSHPDQPNARFLMSLSGNELALLSHDGREGLYRFETAASTTGQMWFRHHTYAGRSSDKAAQISKRPSTFEGRKVTVDPLGRMRFASD